MDRVLAATFPSLCRVRWAREIASVLCGESLNDMIRRRAFPAVGATVAAIDARLTSYAFAGFDALRAQLFSALAGSLGRLILAHVADKDDEAKIEAIGKSKYYSELATWYLYRHLSSPNSALGIDMKAVDTVVGNLLWLATRDRSFDEHVLAVARCRAAADVLQRVGKETEQARLTVDETYRGILALGPKRIPTEKLNSLRLMVSECPPNAQDVRQCVVDVFETRRQDPNSRVREIARLGLEDLEKTSPKGLFPLSRSGSRPDRCLPCDCTHEEVELLVSNAVKRAYHFIDEESLIGPTDAEYTFCHFTVILVTQYGTTTERTRHFDFEDKRYGWGWTNGRSREATSRRS